MTTPKKGAAGSFEMSVHINQTTKRHIPEHCNLNQITTSFLRVVVKIMIRQSLCPSTAPTRHACEVEIFVQLQMFLASAVNGGQC